MIPFRPTVDRVWSAIYELRGDQRPERGYEVVMGYDLYAEWMRSADAVRYGDPWQSGKVTILGAPVRIDPRLQRGWIHLRHEVVR